MKIIGIWLVLAASCFAQQYETVIGPKDGFHPATRDELFSVLKQVGGLPAHSFETREVDAIMDGKGTTALATDASDKIAAWIDSVKLPPLVAGLDSYFLNWDGGAVAIDIRRDKSVCRLQYFSRTFGPSKLFVKMIPGTEPEPVDELAQKLAVINHLLADPRFAILHEQIRAIRDNLLAQ